VRFDIARGEGERQEELKRKKTKVSFFPYCTSREKRRNNVT
jgi:hypothetical protein